MCTCHDSVIPLLITQKKWMYIHKDFTWMFVAALIHANPNQKWLKCPSTGE